MSGEQNDPVLESEQPTTSDQDTSEVTESSNSGRRGFNLTIRQKLIGIVSLIIFLLVAVAGVGIFQMQSIGSEIEEIAEQDMPLTEAITKITVHQLEQAINFERLLRYGEEIESDPSAEAKFEKAFEHFEKLTKQVDLEILEAEKIAERAIDHANTPAARQEFEHVLTALLKIETEHADLCALGVAKRH